MIEWYILVHDMKEQREHKHTLRKYFYIHLSICPLICLLLVFSIVLVLCIVCYTVHLFCMEHFQVQLHYKQRF